MEYKMVTIPFDLETAKKINIGERVGQIVTEKGRNRAEIVAFAYVSASPLSSTWYWSSTESSQAVAWYVVFSSGLTGTGNKHIGDMVRTVIDF